MKQYFSKNPNNVLCIIRTCYPGWWHHSLVQVFHGLWALSHLFFSQTPRTFPTFHPCHEALERSHSSASTFRSPSQGLVLNQHFSPCSIQCQFVMLVFSCTTNVYLRQSTFVLGPFLFLLAFVNTFHIINRENHCP